MTTEIVFNAVVETIRLTPLKHAEDGTPLPRYAVISFKSIDAEMPGIKNEFILPVKDSTSIECGVLVNVKFTPKGFTWKKGKSASKDYWSFAGILSDLTQATNNIKALKSFNTAVRNVVTASVGE
jgi:hypothetical protein